MQRRRYASETMTGLQFRRAETATSAPRAQKPRAKADFSTFTIAAALALGLPALMGARYISPSP
jgi:hypothetical protein